MPVGEGDQRDTIFLMMTWSSNHNSQPGVGFATRFYALFVLVSPGQMNLGD